MRSRHPTQPGHRLFDLPEHPDESCTQSNHDNQEHQCQRRRCEHVQHPRCDANGIPQTTVSETEDIAAQHFPPWPWPRRRRRIRRRTREDPASSLDRFLGDGLSYFGLFALFHKRAGKRCQQPRQMLLILRSICLFSSVISASPLICLLVPAPLPGPDDCAVPAVLVPGGGGDTSPDGFAAPPGP